MAENANEPMFSDAEFSSEERRSMRRMYWYFERSDIFWSTLRRWALIWALIAAGVIYFKDGIKWMMKAIAS